MNSYSWSSRARQDEDPFFYDDEYSVQRICQRIYHELRDAGKHKSISIDELSHRLDYDIEGNKEVMDALENYALIEVDYPNLRYKPPINADNERELLDDLRERPDGVKKADVIEANGDADYMIDNLIRIGRIIGANDDKSNSVATIFPRKHRFVSQLSGTATVTEGSSRVTMTENVSGEIRQGDAVIIRDMVYRVDPSPVRMPFSVSSIQSIDKSIGEFRSSKDWAHYISKEFYLDAKYLGKTESNVPVYKFGATNDIRRLWLDNCEEFYRSEEELDRRIADANLNNERGSANESQQWKRTRVMNSCVCCIDSLYFLMEANSCYVFSFVTYIKSPFLTS